MVTKINLGSGQDQYTPPNKCNLNVVVHGIRAFFGSCISYFPNRIRFRKINSNREVVIDDQNELKKLARCIYGKDFNIDRLNLEIFKANIKRLYIGTNRKKTNESRRTFKKQFNQLKNAAESWVAVDKLMNASSDQHKELFPKLDEFLDPPVTKQNMMERYIEGAELNCFFKNNRNDNSKYLGVFSVSYNKNTNIYSGIDNLIETIKAVSAENTCIAILHDPIRGHYVTILVRDKIACILDTLPSEKIGGGVGDKAAILLRISAIKLDCELTIKVANNQLQQHDDEGDGKWLVNSCGLFPIWLHEFLGLGAKPKKCAEAIVNEFAASIRKLDPSSKHIMNLRTRQDVLVWCNEEMSRHDQKQPEKEEVEDQPA